MSTQRHGRVQEAIRQEISTIIQNEIKDTRIGFITITGVELAKDLRYAKVFFSILGAEKDNTLALKGLNSAKGYIRGLLADKIKLRYIPEIDFRIDKTLERTQAIYDVLNKIKKEKKDEKADRSDK